MKETIIKWGIGIGLTAVLTLLGLYVHYTIRSQVELQLKSAGYPSSSVVELMQKDIDANTERTENLKETADKLDSKIERVVQILLED